ncbi:phosphatase PAP2 family protein [Paenarthrobacter sp. DKR-5]|uniref:phosphatase PAP2 family protein n=1 Tax=Paenarthrobacter sp. DKR-5 TaxID=2835535 RepID=UPI001BDBEA7C|nr:phosphatase PAP2 family protein [Paenarthrobacter sp. DKR-5]MBT1004230.1 phosphatase PAP2 family protein [Paenarthrobacter sp. DKR-5]
MAQLLAPRRYRRGPLRAWSAVSLAAFTVLGALVMLDRRHPVFQPLDLAWSGLVSAFRSGWLTDANYVLNWLGLWGMWLFHAAFFAALWLGGRRASAAYTAVTGVTALVATDGVKILVDRQRPEDRLVSVTTNSFPSGHVSATCVALVAAAFVVGHAWAWAAAGAGTVLMMYSRTYLGVHWFSDVVAGALLGLGIAAAFWLPFQLRCVSRNAPPVRAPGAAGPPES